MDEILVPPLSMIRLLLRKSWPISMLIHSPIFQTPKTYRVAGRGVQVPEASIRSAKFQTSFAMKV
ncbi:hypothetical protein CKO15_09910 [Halorhodospira abdelmalekii]|nr:hypothetical protein [Halorhodospira abdelmalekii]